MFSDLNFFVSQERVRDMRAQAARPRAERRRQSPVSRVTLRQAVAADRPGLRELAELDSTDAPSGIMLVAEVDGRLRAALPLEGGCAIADPFFRGQQLVELLRLRASQLSR